MIKVTDIIGENGFFEYLQAKLISADKIVADSGDFKKLYATVGAIDNLLAGNVSSEISHVIKLTADNVTIDEAVIRDMIAVNITASMLKAGDISTDKFHILSDDGGIDIAGNTMQFKDENNVVRIQIGKDASGNFTFALFSQDGQGILIDETGIKTGAVPDGLIVNDMVSDNANISGGKLDISSVISSINNNTNTLNSSKIKFDDTNQTLDVAFNQLKTKVETIENVTIDGDLSSVIEQVNTNTTNISVAQGQISSLIANTTITKQDGTVVQLKDVFNNTKDTVDSHTQTINSLETTLTDVTAKQSEFIQNLDGFKTTVSETYVPKTEMNSLREELGDYTMLITSETIVIKCDENGNLL